MDSQRVYVTPHLLEQYHVTDYYSRYSSYRVKVVNFTCKIGVKLMKIVQKSFFTIST